MCTLCCCHEKHICSHGWLLHPVHWSNSTARSAHKCLQMQPKQQHGGGCALAGDNKHKSTCCY